MRDHPSQGNLIAAHSRRKTIAAITTNAPTVSPILTNHLAAGRLKHKRVLGAVITAAG